MSFDLRSLMADYSDWFVFAGLLAGLVSVLDLLPGNWSGELTTWAVAALIILAIIVFYLEYFGKKKTGRRPRNTQGVGSPDHNELFNRGY